VDLRVLERGRGRRRAGHVPAQEQREREEAVADPRQEAAAREPPDARVERAVLLLRQPALAGEGPRTLLEVECLDEAQVEERPEGRLAPLHEALHGQLSLGN
jgi:hypothetical protein